MAARPQDRLRDYKAVIERGLSTFTEVGRALAEIRDSRLYLLRSDCRRGPCPDRAGAEAREDQNRPSVPAPPGHIARRLPSRRA